MNLARVDQIARAVLYEGYLLYPYRPSSVKNQQRFNFGVLYPPAYSDAQGGTDPTFMQTECLVQGRTESSLEIRLRFLHLHRRTGCQHAPCALPEGWQDAAEREVILPAIGLHESDSQSLTRRFSFPEDMSAERKRFLDHQQFALEAVVDFSAVRACGDLFKLTIRVRNVTHDISVPTRDEALLHSLVSTHLVLGVECGEFISLLDPPAEFQSFAAQCENIGVWPVLVGDPGQHDTQLASPIILYDYPQIAPESAGDLFDGTEIDEILSLRIMTLTDEEKQEIRNSDERARQILERTDSMPAEQFMKLHGAVRGLRPLTREEDSA